MVEFVTISQSNLGPLIYRAFEGDRILITQLHIQGGSVTECVRHTFKEIDRVATSEEGKDLQFYGLYLKGSPIGFTVIGPKYLLSFGINIMHRSKDIVLSWWNQVCEKLNYEFVTWLYKKNTRVIDFVTRNGMRVLEQDEIQVDERLVTLIYQKQ